MNNYTPLQLTLLVVFLFQTTLLAQSKIVPIFGQWGSKASEQVFRLYYEQFPNGQAVLV